VTVTLLHGDAGPENFPFTLVHLGLNMYALYLVGPIVERLYGRVRFLVFYLVAAIGGSLATFAFGDAALGTGASGAIFGLFGVVFAATRLHIPLLDAQSRRMSSQIGSLILINIVIGLSQGFVDNMAHIGGLVTGALLAVAFLPGKVPTLRTMWQPGTDGRISAGGFLSSPTGRMAAIAVLVVAMIVVAYLGETRWGPIAWPAVR
jgi:rhomboid protease GluP